MIESDLEWPTLINDVCPIVTELLGMVAPWSRNQWIQSPHITHTFNHKANMYSKLMAITTACIAPAIAQHTIRNISDTIESDLEWLTLTNDVCPIMTEPLGMVTPWSQNQWIQSLYITHTFDHKANIYSKLMAITTACTDVLCHTMQIILSVFYIHVILQVSLG
jgi:hypothetical protein